MTLDRKPNGLVPPANSPADAPRLTEPIPTWTTRRVYRLVKRTVAFAIPLSAITVVLVLSLAPNEAVFESEILTVVLNTIFIAISSLAVAFISARAYITSGILRLLLLGCATLLYGIGALVGAILIDAPSGPNQAITIHNIATFLAGWVHLIVASLFSGCFVLSDTDRGRSGRVALAYGSLALFAVALTLAAVNNLLPPFFVQDAGSTPLRRIVLGTGIGTFGVSGFLLFLTYRDTHAEFHFWYGLALVTTAIGLLAVFSQAATGSLLNWTGRIIQEVGGIYFWVAVLLIVRQGKVRGIALDLQIASFFRDAGANLNALVETATDAIIVADGRGTILLWNPAAERMFGYPSAAVLGTKLTRDIFPPEFAGYLERRPAGVAPENTMAELVTRRADGELVPVGLSIATRRQGLTWTSTLIVRDISDRKRAEDYGRAIDHINGYMHSTLDPHEIMQRAVKEAAVAIGCDSATIALRSDGGWTVGYVHGIPSEIIGLRTDDDQERHAILAVETRKPVAISDALHDDRVNREHLRKWGIRSVLVVPLIARDQASGVLFFNYHHAPVAFQPRHLDFAGKLAATIALALQNARLYGDLQRELGEHAQAEASLRQAIQALQVSEQRFRVALRNSPVTVYNQDLELHYTWIYDPARGYGSETITDHTPGELTPDYAGGPLDETTRHVMQSGIGERVERAALAVDGTPRFYDLSIEPLFGSAGNVIGVTCASIDITSRKQTEERIKSLNEDLARQAQELREANASLEQQTAELQLANLNMELALAKEQVARVEAEASQRILESLMEYVPVGIGIGSAAENRVRMISRSGVNLTGRTREALTHATLAEHPQAWDLFLPDGVTRPAPEKLPLYRAMEQGDTVLDHELIFRRPDGDLVTVLASAAPIRDKTGRITGGIVAWQDIRARKQVEQEIRRLNRDLECRNTDLEIANRELESFSYSISHDLRTPLASIHGFATLLLQDYGTHLAPEARRFAELIANNSTEMTQLVEGLLTFSRFNRQPINKQHVDMEQLTRGVVEDLTSRTTGRQIEVTISPLPPCQADPLLLRQVLTNLISNAIKFTRRRDVARIEIGCQVTEEHENLYYIRDNGVGFDDEQAEKLFGVFQRLHHSEDYEGTGVGLAIVERIIHRHGGRVCAEAEVDKGATFCFTAP